MVANENNTPSEINRISNTVISVVIHRKDKENFIELGNMDSKGLINSKDRYGKNKYFLS